MNSVSSPDEIFAASKRVIDTLYGDVSDFKINETFQKPEKGPRESWDVQVNFWHILNQPIPPIVIIFS